MSNRMWTGMTFVGAGLGITISFLITLAVSAGIGTGEYYPCVPELTEACGSELAAVGVQTIISAGYGAVCVLLSRIWSIESWSLMKQTAVFFVSLCAVGVLCGYLAYWMPHNLPGMLVYVLIFAAIFAVIWIAEYQTGKKKVREMNEELRRERAKR